MSLKVVKAGILDSIQDTGRFGYRRFGINPTGAMDIESCLRANRLLENNKEEAVIELHFPASTFLFEKQAHIVLTGADFSASIDHQFIPNEHPVFVPENSVLNFSQPRAGARCYLSVAGGFEIAKWLNSYSTHLKAEMGGWHGRRLLKNDVIPFRRNIEKESKKI